MRSAPWLSLLLIPLASAQQPVPLACGVPDDVHFFVHGLTSPTPDPAMARFDCAMRMLVDSGIHEDVIDLATIDLGARQREEVRGMIRHVCNLIGRVDWPLLVEREMVIAYRMSMPMPEYMAIFRVPTDRVAGQLSGLKEMLGGLAEMLGLPPDSVREVERQSGTMTVLAVQGSPLELAAGAVGDTLVMSTSTRMTAASMRLLAQGDGARSMATSEQFKTSLAQLPPPTEDAVYVDVHGLMDFCRQVMKTALLGMGGQGERANWSREIIGLATAMIDEFDVVDHVLATTRSDGTTTTATSVVQLVPDFNSTGLARVVAGQQPWTDWYKRVPADATGFGFDPGIDYAALFDLVVARLRESEPIAAELGRQQRVLDALRDGLGHISGEMAWVSFPTAGPEGCTIGETVAILRLEKPDAIAALLPQWLGSASQFLAGRGQRMTVTTRDGVHRIDLAAFPWMHPTLGVRGDELVLASSPAALAKVDRVRQGLEPGIRQRADFAALGVGGRDAVDALSYGRMTTGMGGLPDLISAAGFGLSLLPEDRDTRPILKLGTILTKLAPAMRELDLGYDWAMESMPGKTAETWVSRSVVRYHERR